MAQRYAALVRGSGAVFPRGYLWLIPLWYAVAAAALVVKGQLPAWYEAVALIALLLATLILAAVLATMRHYAFAADGHGIWLGTLPRRARSKRGRMLVPWWQVQQVRIIERRRGPKVEVILGPAASIIHRHHVVSHLFFAGLMVIVPPPLLRRPAGLLFPRADPPRYRVPLCDVAADEVACALAALAPPTTQVLLVSR